MIPTDILYQDRPSGPRFKMDLFVYQEW